MTETNGNKGGAPAGNANHFSTGLRGALTLGSVPKRYSYVRKIAGRFRREVETAALAVHGSLGLLELAYAQSATRHELRCLYAMRALRDGADDLLLADRLRLMDTIGNATDSRDKCLQRLGLDTRREDRDPWAIIDNPPAIAHDAPHDAPQRDVSQAVPKVTEAAPDAPGAAVDPRKGESADGQ